MWWRVDEQYEIVTRNNKCTYVSPTTSQTLTHNLKPLVGKSSIYYQLMLAPTIFLSYLRT